MYGHVAALRWAVENGAEADEDTCSWAAEGGSLEALKVLRELDVEWDDDVCTEAAGAGHLEVLRWARANGAELDWEGAANAAGENERVEVVEWLRAQPDYDARHCPELEEVAAELGMVDAQPAAEAN